MQTVSAPKTISQFFSAAVQLILYSRGVYPAESFERRRLFDVAVYRSRCPDVADYVDMCVQGLMELMQRREADALVVLILRDGVATRHASTTPVVLERFVFDLNTLHSGIEDACTDVDASLRGFLLKLHVCDSLLEPLPAHPAELTFSIELHTRPARDSSALSEELRRNWVECDLHSEVGAVAGQSHIVPLKSVRSPTVFMQLFVQEASRSAKLGRVARTA